MLVAGCGGGDEAAPPVRTTVSPVDPAEVGGPLPQALSLVAAGRIYILRAGQGVRPMAGSRGLLPSAWSPDGSLLLARGPGPDGASLRVLTVGGSSPPRTIARGLTGATWSPDGSRIAARRGDGIVVFTPGGAETRVGTTGAPAGATGDAAAWSPDGERLAFPGEGPALAVAGAGGGPVARIPVGAVGRPAGPAWSPDGTRIAFGLRGGVHVVAAAGGAPRRLASGSAPAWAPDGSRIAFVGPRVGRNGVVSPEGGGVNLLPGCRCDLPGARAARTIAWSYNVGRLVYVSGRGNDMSTVRPDGTGVTIAVGFPGAPPRRVLWVPRAA
jgi:dipeptidyl aminopeptidase/acylaminoacyl peptidase